VPRTTTGSAYELFSGTEILGKMAMERMLAGLSTRRYGLGLEPVSAAVTESARAVLDVFDHPVPTTYSRAMWIARGCGSRLE